MLKVANYEVTPQIASFCTRRSLRLMGTQACEDAFHAQKAQARKHPTLRIADESCYHILHHRQVLTRVHHFVEPPCGSEIAPRSSQLADTAFEPSDKHTWKELRRCSGTNQTPKWHSPGAGGRNATIGELETLRMAVPKGLCGKLDEMVVYSALLQGSDMLVRDLRTGIDGSWRFVLTELSPSCHLGWNACCVQYEGYTDVAYKFEGSASTPFWHPLMVDDPERWEVLPYARRSPLYQRLRWPKAPQTSIANACIMACPTTKPTSLLRFSAQQAFGDLPRPWLLQFAKVRSIETHAADTLFDILWTIVRETLKPIDDDDLLHIMKLRTIRSSLRSVGAELLDVDELRDMMTKDEIQQHAKQKEDHESHETHRRDFKAAYKEKKRKVGELKIAALAKAKAKCKAKAKAAPNPAEDALKRLKALAMVPADAILQPQAARMCPPRGHIWNNWKGAAWCGHLPPYARISSLWAVYGHREACLTVLRAMWRRWLADNEMAIERCPVAGLFDA